MVWTPPEARRIFEAIDATWAPARIWRDGDWWLRAGAGGGKRVSAATLAQGAGDIAAGAAAMEAAGQAPLFMLRPGEEALDARLEAAGFVPIDPVTVYAAPPGKLAGALPRLAALPCEGPLARQREIWAAGGIGPARLAIMERVRVPKTWLLAREGDRPAGAGFVACADGIAMLHAVEILPEYRRKGVGRRLLTGAANWAAEQGAEALAVLSVRENAAAIGLWQAAGMAPVTGYHYRIGRGR